MRPVKRTGTSGLEQLLKMVNRWSVLLHGNPINKQFLARVFYCNNNCCSRAVQKQFAGTPETLGSANHYWRFDFLAARKDPDRLTVQKIYSNVQKMGWFIFFVQVLPPIKPAAVVWDVLSSAYAVSVRAGNLI